MPRRGATVRATTPPGKWRAARFTAFAVKLCAAGLRTSVSIKKNLAPGWERSFRTFTRDDSNGQWGPVQRKEPRGSVNARVRQVRQPGTVSAMKRLGTTILRRGKRRVRSLAPRCACHSAKRCTWTRSLRRFGSRFSRLSGSIFSSRATIISACDEKKQRVEINRRRRQKNRSKNQISAGRRIEAHPAVGSRP